MSNRYYKKATDDLKNRYDVDIIFDVFLGRKDRVFLYADTSDFEHVELKLISGTLEYIGLPNGDSFLLHDLLSKIDLTNKYAEISGKDIYIDYVYGELFKFENEVDVTFPVIINNNRNWLRFNIFPIEKHKNLSVFSISNVTKLLSKEEAIYEKTHKDALTNLFNKYTLDYHYGLRYKNKNFHAIYLDLDNFKLLNDTYGHASGNEYLKNFSSLLKSYETDISKFYRIGGDEFIGLVFDTERNVKKIAEDILMQTRQIRVPKCDKNVTVSIGIIQATKREDVLRKADDLLYKVKTSGKNNYLYEVET